jgi:hypothetical protein
MEAKIGADIHVREASFQCERKSDVTGSTYYVLRVGEGAGCATLYLNPSRVVDLLRAVAPHAEAAAAECTSQKVAA